jgi:hypothetical protein
MARKMMLALLVLSALATTGCTVRATRDFAFTRPRGDYGRIVVQTANGRVRLSCGYVEEVRIAARTRAQGATFAAAQANLDAIEVRAEPDEKDAGTLRVGVYVPAELAHAWSGTDLDVRVPTHCAAEITTSNGPIYVADTKECALLETSNGPIDIERVAGVADAHTSNGRIKALCVAGDLTARTSNGTIQVNRVQGNCRLRTSNAGIKVLDAGADVDATTSNGPIRFEAAAADDQLKTGTTTEGGPTVELHTSNGSITLLLSKQLQGDLRLSTSNAAIHVDLPNVAANLRRMTNDELQATLNGGGPAAVVAETSNGPIRVDFR